MSINAFTSQFSWLQFLAGLGMAVLVAALAYSLRSLSRSGAVMAGLLGTAVFGLGGWSWAILLLGFFITSSLLSRLFKEQKAGLDEKFAKGSHRDAGQVLANGGIVGLLVIVQAIFPDSAWPWMGAAAALAAANADTWATELGVLSPTPPRLVTSGERVEMGASGGITLVGTFAALCGSLLIAFLAVIVWPNYAGGVSLGGFFPRLGLVTLAGFVGCLVDSVLGATVQAIYACPACRKETEKHPLHTCGTQTVLKRGWPWLNNDWVNAACTASAAALSAVAAVAIPVTLGIAAADASLPAEEVSMNLSSPAFTNGSSIPSEYTCSGQNVSPALNWSQVPAGALSFALIVEDPDAPSGTFTHWVIYNLPAVMTGLPRNIPQGAQVPGVGSQGKNDFGQSGYGGPCPPSGKTHRYYFRLYALDRSPDLAAGLSKAALLKAIDGHILAEGVWMGTFKR